MALPYCLYNESFSPLIKDCKVCRSAIIEKVFCPPNQKQPVCRIKGFEQPLTTYKMSAFCSRIATKNKDAKCSLVLTIAAQYGLVSQDSLINQLQVKILQDITYFIKESLLITEVTLLDMIGELSNDWTIVTKVFYQLFIYASK